MNISGRVLLVRTDLKTRTWSFKLYSVSRSLLMLCSIVAESHLHRRSLLGQVSNVALCAI